MATKQKLEQELADRIRDIEALQEELSRCEKDRDYAQEEAEDNRREADDLEVERDELQEQLDESHVGTIALLQCRGLNTFGEWLATAIANLLEPGRDLEILDLLEKLGNEETRKAVTAYLETLEMINL